MRENSKADAVKGTSKLSCKAEVCGVADSKSYSLQYISEYYVIPIEVIRSSGLL
jgi:hypothetical protein